MAAGATILWLASIGVILYGFLMSRDAPATPFGDTGRAVAIGVADDTQFDGLVTSIRAFINICPIGADGRWKVVFSYTLNVPEGNSGGPGFFADAPPLYLIAPADLAHLNPERKVLVDDRGEVVHTEKPLSAATIVRHDDLHAVIKITATEPAGYQGSELAYYGVNFTTRSFSRDERGLGVRDFKFSYLPRLAREAGFSPGLGGAAPRPGSGEKDIAIIACGDDERDSMSFENDRYSPVSGEEVGGGKRLWEVAATEPLTINGSVSGGWKKRLHDYAAWFSVNAFAAVLGAIYGAGIEPPADQPSRSIRDGTGRARRTARSSSSRRWS